MSKVHCFTSISFSYLDRARVLAETVKRFHPDWTLWLFVSDRAPEGFAFDPDTELFDQVVWIDELPIVERMSWIFKHDVIELCTAVKGPMLVRLLERGAENVVYLDPDIALFSDLHEIERLLDARSIVLTPHIVDPENGHQAIIDNEVGTLKHGTYNLGFLAIRNRPEGIRFARWWQDRLLNYCYDDIENGVFTDQRWCDLIPGFFDDVHVLRDPGYNVASWNLNRRPITFDSQGTIRAAGEKLRFFHFTKINAIGEVMLARYAGEAVGAFELLKWYRGRLAHHATSGLPRRWWAFSVFEDGEPIRREHRLLYRSRADLQTAFPNPFSSEAHSYRDWFAQHANVNPG